MKSRGIVPQVLLAIVLIGITVLAPGTSEKRAQAAPAVFWTVFPDGCRYEWGGPSLRWQQAECGYEVIDGSNPATPWLTGGFAWLNNRWELQTVNLSLVDDYGYPFVQHWAEGHGAVFVQYVNSEAPEWVRVAIDRTTQQLYVETPQGWVGESEFYFLKIYGHFAGYPTIDILNPSLCTTVGLGYDTDWNGDHQTNYLDNELHCRTNP